MFKLFVLTIFLIISPTFGLVKSLFKTETDCYSGCISNYGGIISKLDACKNGCFFKLHNENCANQCKLYSIDEDIQASCIVGCSMNQPMIKQIHETIEPKSIIFIRLHQPLVRLPFTQNDPVKMFNNIIKQMKEQSKSIEQSNELKSIVNLMKDIPLIKSSNEEHTNEIKHILIHQEVEHNYFQQIMKQICSKWHDLTQKDFKFSAWILFSLSIISSIILWYMIVSLCRNKPKYHNLSIRAEELILEKEILQPDTPVKIKLTNI